MPLLRALRKPRTPPYRLLQPICWTRAQGAAWMLAQHSPDDTPIWRCLRGEMLGEGERQQIAGHWLFLRYCRARE